MVTVTVTGGQKAGAALKKIAKSVRKSEVRIGFLEGARYPDGTSVAMVAAIQEFGAPAVGIPPRPFFRTMVKTKSPLWPKMAAALIKNTDYKVEDVLKAFGARVATDLRQSIIDLDTPPLSPVTLMIRMMKKKNPGLVMGKGVVAEARRRVLAGQVASGVSIKPLVSTGYMLQSIDYKVKK